MIERTVARIVAAALRLPWLTVLLAIALTAGAVQYISTHFAITTDTSQLISSDLDWRQARGRSWMSARTSAGTLCASRCARRRTFSMRSLRLMPRA